MEPYQYHTFRVTVRRAANSLRSAADETFLAEFALLVHEQTEKFLEVPGPADDDVPSRLESMRCSMRNITLCHL